MKRYKKMTALCLAVLLSISTIVAGCGSKNNTTNGESNNSNSSSNDSTNNSNSKVSIPTDEDFANSLDAIDNTKQANSEKLLLTIGDKKIYMDEALFYIYAMEYQGSYYDMMYQMYYGTGYWDMEIDSGVTVRQKAKEQVIDSIIQTEVLYNEAIKDGYKLTEEELTTQEENVKAIMEEFSDSVIDRIGITEKVVETVENKLAIVAKYQADKIESFDIDDKAIKDSINKDDYKEYNTKCIYANTQTTDEEGNTKDLKDDELKSIKSAMEKALKKAKNGKDFSKIVKNNDKLAETTNDFVVNDGTVDEAYQKAAQNLKNNEISEIIEGEGRLYIIQMLDNDVQDAYEEAVNSAISTEENNQFEKFYQDLLKNYKTEVDSIWDKIVIGKNTIEEETQDNETNTDNNNTDETKTDSDNTNADETKTDNDNTNADETKTNNNNTNTDETKTSNNTNTKTN